MWQFKLNEWLEVKPLEITHRDKSLLVYMGLKWGILLIPASLFTAYLLSSRSFGMACTVQYDRQKTNVMRWSNGNFSSTQGKLGHLTIFCARGVGNLICKAFPGVENWPLLGYAGENWTGSVRFQIIYIFSGAEVANSYEHMFGRDWIN